MTKDEALKMALEALEFMSHVDSIFANEFDFQINAIKEALAQPEQEPVAWAMLHDNGHFIDAIHPDEHARVEGEYTHPLYTSPPQRTWVNATTWRGLTEAQCGVLWKTNMTPFEYYQAIEAKLRSKNHD